MSRTTMLALLLALTAPAPAARAQARIPTDVAMKQIIKRVEPVVPPEAAAQKVGGPVIADIIVSPRGTVESVTVAAACSIGGPATIAQDVWAQVRNWPFTVSWSATGGTQTALLRRKGATWAIVELSGG